MPPRARPRLEPSANERSSADAFDTDTASGGTDTEQPRGDIERDAPFDAILTHATNEVLTYHFAFRSCSRHSLMEGRSLDEIDPAIVAQIRIRPYARGLGLYLEVAQGANDSVKVNFVHDPLALLAGKLPPEETSPHQRRRRPAASRSSAWVLARFYDLCHTTKLFRRAQSVPRAYCTVFAVPKKTRSLGSSSTGGSEIGCSSVWKAFAFSSCPTFTTPFGGGVTVRHYC